ncbi:O-acetyl-ADP-ribose deacetylase [bacterium]|nr:O-acetyl-ADP-ribose deacetylase [bacterium]
MREFLDGRIIVKTGDITHETVDAIVNAANSGLMGGGGVDGAIHRAGGHEILDACKKIRKEQFPDGLPTGEAVITTSGRLPCRYVIHTVGPVWRGGKHDEKQLLGNCYRNSLKVAVDTGCSTVAFPAISTGVYGFPKELAAAIASAVIKDFLATDESIKMVVFVFFSSTDESVFVANQVF